MEELIGQPDQNEDEYDPNDRPGRQLELGDCSLCRNLQGCAGSPESRE
jgi:hypothetical protein